LAGRALKSGIWALETVDIRDYARDKHASVDGPPAGGGSGMVLRADVLARAIDAASDASDPRPRIVLTPRGIPLTQARVRDLASGPGAVLLAGRFEGIDQRVIEARGLEEVSLGDFVLSGGELAALALMDAVIRTLPGVMGGAGSLEEESFESGLLEYPQFTRPAVWEGREIPPVLVSGHHGKVAEWRKAEAERVTRDRRPDLWARYRAAGSDGEE
jgi:tRNA (guanine37-N1)-methyltransferase